MLKHYIISNNDPIKFYQDCQRFEDSNKDLILDKFQCHMGFPVQSQAVNIPGFKMPMQNITIQMNYSCTYIVKQQEHQ